MQISRDAVIYTMDQAMSEGHVLTKNIDSAKLEIKSMMEEGSIDGNWYIASRRPIIGKLIILVKRFMRKMLHGYIPPIVEKINHIRESQNRVLQYLTSAVEELSIQAAEAEKKQKVCEEYIETLKKQQNDYEEYIEILKRQQNDCQEYVESMEQHLNKVIKTVQRAEETGRFEIKNELLDVFSYVKFENRYRGNVELIKQWQNIYLEYFVGRENVLDLGCGRGEFLTLLRENGIPGKGIDMTDDMINYCKTLGLDVEQADIFAYLEKIDDCALDGVFCNQVVEHFTTQQLLRLIQLLNKKVRIGAPVIIETINPGNLSSSANGFYMDLSHIRPVHSATLSFLLETNGFPMQKVLYLHPETDKEIPSLNIKGAEEFNNKMQNVNKLLFGARDYAVIAFKQKEEML